MNTTGSPVRWNTQITRLSRGSAGPGPGDHHPRLQRGATTARRHSRSFRLTSAVCRSTRRSWSWTTEVSIAPLIWWRISSTATCRCTCSVAMSRARVRLCDGVCCQAARQWSGFLTPTPPRRSTLSARVLDALTDGADVAIAVRRGADTADGRGAMARRAGSFLFSAMVGSLTGTDDSQCGFKFFREDRRRHGVQRSTARWARLRR